MAHLLNPEGVMETLRDGTLEAVKDIFPIVGKTNTLRMTNAYGDSNKSVDDVVGQRKARLTGRTWSTGVFADFELVDNKTGAVIDKKSKVKLLSLPHITRRYSYIVDGNEYQVDNQWRLKSGVYTRQRADGDLETQFNLTKGRGFRMLFDPKKKNFILNYDTTNVQLLPVLQALGVPDTDIQKSWSKTIYAQGLANKKKNQLTKLARALDKRATVTNEEEAANVIRAVYADTGLRKDTTKITLGKAYDKVDGPSLLAASNKLLRVNRGDDKIDNRDALQFKELWSVEDFIPERIKNSRRRITRKIKNNIDRKTQVRAMISSDTFNMPVRAFFTSGSLAQPSSQVNPLSMINSHLRTTLLGPGGISTSNAVSFDAKLIDPSHLGFLDPVATPEGDRTGITLHLGLGVNKIGKEAAIRLYDVKSGKTVMKTPPEVSNSIIGFPDQYTWKDGKPKPKSDMITVSTAGGDPKLAKASSVDYVITSPKGMFSLTSNMIPFLASDQANRAEMATRHLEQAIVLKNREQPFVQVHTGNPKENQTWEQVVGKFSAHKAPVSGTVSSISKDDITVSDKLGKKHKIELYNNYPLNDKKAFVTSKPLVKKGDTVKKGQIIGDTSFTKDGVLSMGVNLRVGYLPFKGLVFEDGIVISEDASEKLTSEHMYKERTYLEKNMVADLKKFRANYPGAISDENAQKMTDDGIVKEGQTINPGETIMAVLKKSEPSKEQLLLKGIHRSLSRPFKDASVVWDKAVPGKVTDVIRTGREIKVLVRTDEKADIGDKLSGRHGNKGVITAVLPGEEMPKDADGKPLDIIFNPSGVPGRINVGQVLETNLGAVAHKTGESYAVNNFEPEDENKIVKVKGHYRTVKTKEGPKTVFIEPYEYERGYHEMVKEEMSKHDVSATVELFDPDTGKSLGQVMVGRQYILKLMHQVDKKMSSRAHGYGQDYDANMVPKGGGKSGAQKFGGLGMFALISHGATANIRDAMSFKSDKTQDDVWTAIQAGDILPSPKPSFAYSKFVAYLNGLGVNVEKDGNGLTLIPLTDKELDGVTNGELTNPSRVLRGKDLKPEAGGLFDEKVTGGPGGNKWSHITLASPIPNPMYAKAITSLLGLKEKDYRAIMEGKKTLKDGEAVDVSEGDKTGPTLIVDAIKRVNVKKDLAAAKEKLGTARKSELNKVNKRVKYLRMLDKTGLSPEEAYVMKRLPVLPPVFRPITAMEGGDINIDGLNLLYKDVALINEKLKEATGVLSDESLASTRADLYDSMVALMATGTASKQSGVTLDGQIRPPGILEILSGQGSPKKGFFHQKILDRKQDLTMRSVIVPDLDLHLDEVGIPRKGAMQIYRPFVVKELVGMGYTPLSAREEIEKNSGLANKALEVVVGKRPVLFKRDPVLHKFGIMAFKPRLHKESAIHIHPLVVGGFGADFDGDTMALFVPVSNEAVEESYKLLPSKNLFNPSTGRVMYQPSLEGQMGLFLLTQFGKSTNKKFTKEDDALSSVSKGQLSMTDVITVGGKKTTAGRITFNRALPDGVRSDKYLADKNLVMNGKNLQATMREIATKTPQDFQVTADKFKELGFGHSYNIGFSFKADDFAALKKVRNKHLKIADSKVRGLSSSLGEKARNKAIIDIYGKATTDIAKDAKAQMSKEGNALFAMYSAGVKPGWAQLQQLVIAPMLLQNAKNEIIPVPVKTSYSEGLDTAGYWVASSGARKGLIEKVQSVSKPGALSKQIMNTMLPYVVTNNDCGTAKGIALDTSDNDIIDRYLAKPAKFGSRTLPSGTLVTADLLADAKANKVSKLVVRSPLKCQTPKGMCGKCYGAFDTGADPGIGTNIGAIAGQSIGERAVQVSMKQFHCNHADALVVFSDGMGVTVETMESLYDEADVGVESIGGEEIKYVGDSGWKVLTSTGWTKVTAVRRHAPDSKMVAVQTGRNITVCQDNHPIGVGPIDDITWVEAGQTEGKHVQLKDFCLGPVKRGREPLDIPAYVAGMYLAEGCIAYAKSHKNQKEKKPYRVEFGQNDGEVKDWLLESMPKKWNAKAYKDRVVIHRLHLGYRFEELFGRFSNKKRLPSDFVHYSDGWLREMLRGVFDGDGTILRADDGPDRVIIDTTSFTLAQQLLIVANQLKLVAGIRVTPKRELTRHQGYAVEIKVTEIAKDLFKWCPKGKNLSKVSPKQEPKFGPRKVTKIKDVFYTDKYVYDLTTESGTLFVSGVLHHNTGGVAGASGKLMSSMDRLTQLLKLPAKLPDAAVISPVAASVSSVTKSPAGGFDVKIGDSKVYVPAARQLLVKKGDSIKKGQQLTDGLVNPRELLQHTNIDRVQRYISDEIHKVFSTEGVKRRNIEVVTKALTNLGLVRNSGTVDGILRGDYVSLSHASDLNSKAKVPMKVEPVLRGIETLALDQTTDWLARLQYRKLKETFVRGASEGWSSDIHGLHPTPGVVYSAEFGKPKDKTKGPY